MLQQYKRVPTINKGTWRQSWMCLKTKTKGGKKLFATVQGNKILKKQKLPPHELE